MRRGLIVLVTLIILTVIGGAITSQFLSVPTIVQSDRPDASVFEATPEQATQFFIWVGFVLVNVIGAGVTIGVIFWLLNRGLRRAETQPEPQGEIAEQAS